ncbi:hypothetical protein [Fontivita pretiosa]|uniref:hypothetical protein n=1 Tax=Fontivita pretiosa TaxID=2989684 RepID=UPI003D1742F8
MTKRQLIEQIRQINTSAQPQFLAQFDDAALKQYLEHLQAAQKRVLRISGWVRDPRHRKLRLVS